MAVKKKKKKGKQMHIKRTHLKIGCLALFELKKKM